MPTNNIRHKSLKLRIYPNKSQKILINKTFGCCRLIYNLHIDEWNKYYESIKNLSKKDMNDTSWGTFVTRLEDKGKDYNCSVIKADRFFPSSQLCSNCGYQYHELKLSERKWICPKCGTNHIRDINAAINLKYYIPKELREFMPVEGIDELAKLALQVSEYPMKQESLIIN